MTDEPTAAEGIHASAAPELPPLPGTSQPATLSFAEGSSQGLPACSPALPKVLPLTDVAKSVYTSTSTKHYSDLPGVGQVYLLAAQDLVSAAAAQPQSPEKHNLLKEREKTPEAVEQPTASSPSDERARKTEQPVGWAVLQHDWAAVHPWQLGWHGNSILPACGRRGVIRPVRWEGSSPTGIFFACARLSPRHRANYETVPAGSS